MTRALANVFPAQNCREMNGAHSCDKRGTRSEVQVEFPNVVFEDGFEEDDILWTPERESYESVERRAKLVLDRIFQNDHDDTCAVAPCFSKVTKPRQFFYRYISHST